MSTSPFGGADFFREQIKQFPLEMLARCLVEACKGEDNAKSLIGSCIAVAQLSSAAGLETIIDGAGKVFLAQHMAKREALEKAGRTIDDLTEDEMVIATPMHFSRLSDGTEALVLYSNDKLSPVQFAESYTEHVKTKEPVHHVVTPEGHQKPNRRMGGFSEN